MKRQIDRKNRDTVETAGRAGELGFSLIEVSAAMVVFMIVMLGVFVAFTLAITYNAGNSSRSNALATLQEEIENVRVAKFTPIVVDPLLVGGAKAARSVTSSGGTKLLVDVTVDDDPDTAGVQVNEFTTIKEVTVTVSLDPSAPGWRTSSPSTAILRRTIAN